MTLSVAGTQFQREEPGNTRATDVPETREFPRFACGFSCIISCQRIEIQFSNAWKERAQNRTFSDLCSKHKFSVLLWWLKDKRVRDTICRMFSFSSLLVAFVFGLSSVTYSTDVTKYRKLPFDIWPKDPPSLTSPCTY